MEEFKNESESFYREIRSIEIYKASDVKYINAFNGVFPDPKLALYKYRIVAESYSRGISTKTQNGNYFTDIDVSFPILDMSKSTYDKSHKYFNKKKFAIVLNSNTEKMLLGNDREKIKIEFIDNKKDDNSGNDEFTIAVSGDTIIKPQLQLL
ncbi:hypothetical protein [Chryseobacterium sp.]|uniref:hypothetical protein n=1 Tax=Chryseobacterium sp. TaxID=1871047 RepID=UPI00289C237F|nr:hypothetical protein [Chryseobacterium sp.]